MDDQTTGPQDGQAEAVDPTDPTQTTVQQDMAQPGTLAVRNPYDVAVPETLRERIAYAKAMANAGILPRDYQAKPANVLVAGEMGRELGLSTVQSVLMLNVVEGRPQLGASGVRAVVARAGHYMSPATITYSKHGVPVEATITAWRKGEEDQPHTLSWNIMRAHRAGLCIVKRDQDGEVTEVRAQSKFGKALPWEAFTEDMLDARATTKLGRTLFADVTMGLSYEKDEHEVGTATVSAEQVQQPAAPTPRAAAKIDQVKPTRRTDLPDEYDPAEDLAEAGPTWWEHAGAQVARRNRQQLAADRLAKWVADNPGQLVVPVPGTDPEDQDQDQGAPGGYGSSTMADDVVDAEVVEDMPDDAEPVDVDPLADVPEPEPAVDDAPDPWEDVDPADAEPVDAVPDDAPDLSEPDLAPAEPTTAEVLELIDAAAETLGKTRAALMVRWIATHRKNPENATGAELMAFYDQLRPALEAMQNG